MIKLIMDNKKYLDKVIGSLVRGTRIDYENERITFPFLQSRFFLSFPSPPHSFSTYCKNTFGLTDKEIDYVWEEYVKIIKDKIKNGQ